MRHDGLEQEIISIGQEHEMKATKRDASKQPMRANSTRQSNILFISEVKTLQNIFQPSTVDQKPNAYYLVNFCVKRCINMLLLITIEEGIFCCRSEVDVSRIPKIL
jgi:hypothetical protein